MDMLHANAGSRSMTSTATSKSGLQEHLMTEHSRLLGPPAGTAQKDNSEAASDGNILITNLVPLRTRSGKGRELKMRIREESVCPGKAGGQEHHLSSMYPSSATVQMLHCARMCVCVRVCV